MKDRKIRDQCHYINHEPRMWRVISTSILIDTTVQKLKLSIVNRTHVYSYYCIILCDNCLSDSDE